MEAIEIRGLSELALEKGRVLSSVRSLFPGAIVAYANASDLDLFLELGWQRIQEVKSALSHYRADPVLARERALGRGRLELSLRKFTSLVSKKREPLFFYDTIN